MKENETLTECLACGNIISACFCALFSLWRWNEKALDGCSASIWSKRMSLKAERALVCSPEQISSLWSPVFLDFVQLYKPTSTSDSSALGITQTTGYIYYSMWHCGFTRDEWIFCWNRPINPQPGWSYLSSFRIQANLAKANKQVYTAGNEPNAFENEKKPSKSGRVFSRLASVRFKAVKEQSVLGKSCLFRRFRTLMDALVWSKTPNYGFYYGEGSPHEY